MDHKRTADDGLRAGQQDLRVRDHGFGHACVVSDDVAEVAGVSDRCVWAAVRQAGGVEVAASGEAAVGEVAELVDVEAVLSWKEERRNGAFLRVTYAGSVPSCRRNLCYRWGWSKRVPMRGI